MIRTLQEEIVSRIKASDNLFGFDQDVLISFLDFEHAKEFLKPDATKEQWDRNVLPLTEEAVTEEAKRYMAEYGWPKALGHRGISANRTIDKMTEWIWLLGDDALLAKIEATPYEQYGAPKLAAICSAFGWPVPQDENTQRMIRGEPCKPGCREGCDR